jgi:hypothetical protein
MEVQAGEYCKTVGSAYVGSNPTPATTCENGPWAAETRPGGPFLLCRGMYQHVSPWVDARQWLRTYGGQRPGGTSGAQNRSLCGLVAASGSEDGARHAEAGPVPGVRMPHPVDASSCQHWRPRQNGFG